MFCRPEGGGMVPRAQEGRGRVRRGWDERRGIRGVSMCVISRRPQDEKPAAEESSAALSSLRGGWDIYLCIVCVGNFDVIPWDKNMREKN